MARVIAYITCIDFANKYKIPISNKDGKIPQKILMEKIYNYELKNNVKNGLYFY